jgi:hypothetical protein
MHRQIETMPNGSLRIAIDGLAGCSASDRCPRASTCLRADERLTYRAEPLQCRTGDACLIFIRRTEA